MAELVLVTGGAGFIGSHLVERLLKLGYQVRVLDNLSLGRREWIPTGAYFIEGDITELNTCRSACSGVTGVFHLAAMSRAAPSIDNIELCTTQNVFGTQNILIAARDSGVRKVVYSASSTYYGNHPPPHSEELPHDCLNFYSVSKYVGEQYCLLFDRLYSLSTVVLRYFNVYGPRQPVVGAYALVLGIFLRQWKEGQPLTVHGTGEQRRDFVHVRDVVTATIQAFKSDVRRQVFNVGSGTNISIQNLADMISSNQVFGPPRTGDAAVTLADITRIRSCLGWEPAVRFKDGLDELKNLTRAGLID